MSRDADGQPLGALGKHSRFGVTEEQSADDLAAMERHRHCKVAADWQVVWGHSGVWRVLAVPRVLANIVAAHDSITPKGRAEDLCVARHRELLEALAGGPGEGIQPVGFVLDHVVEECPEGGAGQLSGRIRHELHDPLEIQLSCDRLADVGKGFTCVCLFFERPLSPPPVTDVMGDLGGAHHSTVCVEHR